MPGPVAFGFDPWSGTYKVARVVYRGFEPVPDSHYEVELDIGHEVLTLGGGGAWEETDDPPCYIDYVRPICTRGAFYWTAVVDGGGPHRTTTELLRFCLRDETFAAVPYPPCDCVIGHDTLTELAGKLCCAHAHGSSVDVWLADHDDDGLQQRPEWSVAYRIDFLRPIIEHSVLPLVVHGDELLLSVDRRVIYKFNVATEALVEVVDMQRVPDLYGAKPALPLRLLHHAVPYVESLVAISSRNY
ncbi:unnamed protein product [Urochloa humidicola]